ncbi:hypothetical protein BDV28DRAFT_148027 [Aspergillus coremiiformis]|uniref:Rhodopsin domain-containing protein n=1 Tax=Aspergillus coremiiformis TaxID=138285 RepID=A0A5N6Z6Z8_9EURO|nr:hypothetical protein BDV28DRAFT_148027 [Aspergillus coremiiformis]
MATENLQPLTYGIISIVFALGTASILLRLYGRWCLQTFGGDDVAAGFLLLVNTMQQAILYIFLYYGCGKHVGWLSDWQLEKITLWLFIEEIFYMFTHWTLKQVFLIFYLRLSPRRGFKLSVYGTMALNTIFTVINWLLAIFQCTPFDSILHPAKYPYAVCMNKFVVLMLPSVLNIVTDLIILTLPISTVLALQMSRKRKAVVLGIICFGSFSVITALCRFAILKQLAVDPDISFVLGRMIMVAAVEIEVAVIAVNLPGMKFLFSPPAGRSHDRSVEPSSDVYRMAALQPRASSEQKDRRCLGATLTGSEEELLRRTGGTNIKIMTNVDVTSVRAAE